MVVVISGSAVTAVTLVESLSNEDGNVNENATKQ